MMLKTEKNITRVPFRDRQKRSAASAAVDCAVLWRRTLEWAISLKRHDAAIFWRDGSLVF